jgi:hypothetical protein
MGIGIYGGYRRRSDIVDFGNPRWCSEGFGRAFYCQSVRLAQSAAERSIAKFFKACACRGRRYHASVAATSFVQA